MGSQIDKDSGEVGDCAICRTQSRPLIDASRLSDYFFSVLGAYEESDDGEGLINLLRRDWQLFPSLNDVEANAVLADIFGYVSIFRNRYVPTACESPRRFPKLDQLGDELKHNNRYFPSLTFDTDSLADLLGFLLVSPSIEERNWHRARIGTEESNFALSDISAPPPAQTTAGRANPAGIPYLYLASSQDTAVAEVRPHPGSFVYTAEFTLDLTVRLVDLRTPRVTVSPFLIQDERQVAQLRDDLTFLEQVSNELKRPVVPHSVAFDYVLSQYLCEFIKKCGYDGVLYGSSHGSGCNLALFYPSKANSINLRKLKVNAIKVDAERV